MNSDSTLVHNKVPEPSNIPLKNGSDRANIDSELSFNMTFKKIMRMGAGLQNLGNTCFLNAVLQCLTYTEPLAAYLESGKHQNSCRKAGFCALCAIEKHVSLALRATGRILAPKDLVSNLRCISRNFRNARQEDAHEYMMNLLESMHKCCIPPGIASESPGAYEKSLVHRIFGGRLRSRVMCMQCSYCSDKYDPFLDLSLEINKADSLYKALEHFTAQELLDGGEKQYNCQQCKQKVRARKQLTVDKAPHVLTLHLKRFGSHLPGRKIDKKIRYGPVLDLNCFMSSPHTSDLRYKLYGVLVHAGWSTRSGHYYCFVRTSSGMWYSLDDNKVFQVNERKVMEQKAYMLFYVQDRKSNLPNRHVGVAHKDNSSINCIGTKERECVSKREASTHRDTLNTASPNETSRQVIISSLKDVNAPTSVVSDSTREASIQKDALNISPNEFSRQVIPSLKDVNAPTSVLSEWNSPESIGEGKELSGSIASPLNCNENVICEKVSSDNSSHKPEGDIRPKISSSAMNEANWKANLKIRKKLFKSNTASMRLSSLILGTTLRPWRKRKHKHRKHGISHNKNRSLDHLNGEHVLTDGLGPSTSEQSKVLTTRHLSCKKRPKRASDVEVYNSCVKSQTLGNKSDVGETNGVKDIKLSGLMNMLTRGIEETRVGRWDDTQISPLEVTETGNACVKIGHIGDEWDEHYDQGKRKKVRSSKLDFGGPNPFQEITSKKDAKLKRAKVNQSISPNQSYRILS